MSKSEPLILKLAAIIMIDWRQSKCSGCVVACLLMKTFEIVATFQ